MTRKRPNTNPYPELVQSAGRASGRLWFVPEADSEQNLEIKLEKTDLEEISKPEVEPERETELEVLSDSDQNRKSLHLPVVMPFCGPHPKEKNCSFWHDRRVRTKFECGKCHR